LGKALKIIDKKIVIKEISEAYQNINFNMSDEIKDALTKGLSIEKSKPGINVLNQLLENGRIACSTKIPLCQDCGLAVIFVEHGEDARVEGGLKAAITEGVKLGYGEGYLRKSVVAGLKRVNTKDNTPPIIHIDMVPGDEITIHLGSKGGGSENMSQLKMMTPADGVEGIKKFVDEVVTNAGPNPCPPIIIGVGIGGNFETCALLAKKALFRNINLSNEDPEIAKLEDELLEIANNSGVGPQGLGGVFTALGVNVETFPCHIASFPVAVNIECHSHRHMKLTF